MPFSFFKSKRVTPDLSFIGVDMHSHLLPGLDDGVQYVADSVRFIATLKEMGYHHFVCTPHILHGIHPNSPETILPALDIMQKALQEANVQVGTGAAAEYMVDLEMEEALKKHQTVLPLGKQYVLIEMSYAAPSSNIESTIFELQLQGYKPVLAHPERYNFFHHMPAQLTRLRDMGCLLQLNLLSLSDYYGTGVRRFAEKLVKENQIDFAGTDLHHQRHLDALIELASQKSFYQLLQPLKLRNQELA
ncbi:MAG TPA: histidinol phosphatase [Chitinophagaceae bacterium]|nr:histidinol phosphatase [Chitinophagaceae bacterium]